MERFLWISGIQELESSISLQGVGSAEIAHCRKHMLTSRFNSSTWVRETDNLVVIYLFAECSQSLLVVMAIMAWWGPRKRVGILIILHLTIKIKSLWNISETHEKEKKIAFF